MICKTDLRFPDHERGTTWDGMSLTFSELTPANAKIPFDVSAIKIVAQIRKGASGSVLLELSTTDGSIVLGSPEQPTVSNVMTFLPRIINLQVFDYTVEIKVHYPDGRNYPFPKIFWNITD